MKKTLKVLSFSTGIISAVSALVLGYMYLEDIMKCLKKVNARVSRIIDSK